MLPVVVGRMMVVRLLHKCLVTLCEQSWGGIHNRWDSYFIERRRINSRCIKLTPLHCF